jgi:hypothetical protein
MVYRKPMEIGTLDYREKALLWLQKRHVPDKEGNVITGKYKTPLAIGIPEPLQEFLQFIKLGSVMKEILKPVIELAERVIVTQNKKNASTATGKN